MQIAMHTNADAAFALARQLFNQLQHILAMGSQPVELCRSILGQLILCLQRLVDGFAHLVGNSPGPLDGVLWRAGDMTKVGIIRRPRQQGMHFSQTLAEHGSKRLEFGQRGVLTLHARYAARQFVANGAAQGVLGPLPGIALAAQVALQYHQRVRLPV